LETFDCALRGDEIVGMDVDSNNFRIGAGRIICSLELKLINLRILDCGDGLKYKEEDGEMEGVKQILILDGVFE
jgi:hypothetical protein